MFYDISDVDHLAGDPVSQPVWSLPVVTDSPGTACNFGQCHKRSPAKSPLYPATLAIICSNISYLADAECLRVSLLLSRCAALRDIIHPHGHSGTVSVSAASLGLMRMKY